VETFQRCFPQNPGKFCTLINTQLQELESVQCTKVFQEQVSSVAVRTQLKAAIEFTREGDMLVVTKLDRLARSISELMTIIQTLEKKEVGLRILNLGMDTQSPTGNDAGAAA